jgi:hypothetical protein
VFVVFEVENTMRQIIRELCPEVPSSGPTSASSLPRDVTVITMNQMHCKPNDGKVLTTVRVRELHELDVAPFDKTGDGRENGSVAGRSDGR